jgi:hypothetical protein
LLVHEGPTRADDRVVEAHVYGTFNSDSVESVLFDERDSTRSEQIDMDCIKEILAKRRKLEAKQ